MGPKKVKTKVVVGIASFLVATVIVGSMQGSKRDTSESTLRNTIREMNKRLPLEIDEFTTLKKVEYINTGQKGLRYIYHVRYSKRDVEKRMGIKKWEKMVEEGLRDTECKNSSVLRLLAEGIISEKAYYGNEGALIGTIKTTKEDCPAAFSDYS